LTKYSRTELLGKSFFELLSVADQNNALSRHRRKMQGEPLPGLYEMTIVRQDGKEIPVELTSALSMYRGKPANVIYLRDITQRKIDERRLIEAKAQASALQKSEHIMREFQAMVSHELRTPLAAIKGFASTLLQPDVAWNEEEKADFIKEIDSEVDRLSNIVSDLLDISSMESGRLNENVSENTIAHVLEGIRLGLEAIAEHHVLTINIEADLPLVIMDPEQIAQVFYNLVGNATKFSPEGSQISIQVKKSSGYIVTSVADHGIGMSREEQNKIFDRLYQAKRITYGAKKGTGLGLSICRGIIDKHGGRIWLESQQGKGSTFYFSLPLSKK
jgi:PAS domain S-box-containing protein